jgi:hypothetical protein
MGIGTHRPDRADLVHLLADDRDDLQPDPDRERRQRVVPRLQLADCLVVEGAGLEASVQDADEPVRESPVRA